jgi:hypothetical protein
MCVYVIYFHMYMCVLKYMYYGKFHSGVKGIKEAFDRMLPGHAIPLRVIAELIVLCPTRQKIRLTYGCTLPSENRHLKPAHERSRIGFKTLTITPKEKFDNYLILVCIVQVSSSYQICL